jgi:lysophospholipase L1-like esterase
MFMRRTAWINSLLLLSSVALALPAQAAGSCWTASWATALQVPEPRNALPAEDLHDATLRQVVRTSIGGPQIRLRLSNLFGTEPHVVEAVRIAPSTDPASARTGTGRPVTFAGRPAVTIPAGADYVSDPIDMAVAPLSHLAISLHLPEPPAVQTGHPGSRATSYVTAGQHVADADLPGAKTVDHWYQIARLEVRAAPAAVAVAAIGDSITDGHGVNSNTDRRWTDFLAQRLQSEPATRDIAVLNLGIGGNRVLLDGLGPNMLARFERDVLGQPGVGTAIFLEGVNDLGVLTRDAPASSEAHAALVAEVTGAFRQMVARARERGVFTIGGTILPYGGSEYYHPDAVNEADRQAINAWIRTPGNFDAVVDFDAAMRDPANPARLRPDYDLGDGLHPSDAGYQAMAALVPDALLRKSARSGCD